MRRVEWNGPGLYYKLWYRRVNSSDEFEVRLEASNDSFVVPYAGYYVQWEFQIQAINEVGEGPKSPLVKQFSGQDPPKGKPEDVTVGTITARSVELLWKPVTFTRGSVDGYRVSGNFCTIFLRFFLFLFPFLFYFSIFFQVEWKKKVLFLIVNSN